MARKPNVRDVKASALGRGKGKPTVTDDDLEDQDDTGRDDNEDPEIVRGGPGQEDLDQDDKTVKGKTTHETVDLVIGGKSFKGIPKDLADSIQSTSVDPGEIRRLQDQISELKRTTSKTETKPDDEDKDLDGIDSLIFTDPKKALKLIRSQAEERAVKRVTTAYVGDQAVKAFWEGFNKQYPELKEAQWLCEQLAQEKARELDPLTVAEGSKRLAAYAHERITGLVKMAGGRPGERPKTRTTVESGGGTGSGRTQRDETTTTRTDDRSDDEPISLSDILKQRRESRRTSMTKFNRRRA